MLKSVLALTKPRVTAMTVFMAGGGMLLAGSPADLQFALALIGVALSVGCANGLNMAIERDTDGMMVRTSSRPLPSGDLTVQTAVAASLAMGLGSVVLLLASTNVLTTGLGVFAIVTYAGVYTPLKQRSTLALPVGAIPGAIPPLMGYTAYTNEVTTEALALFGILALWQIPHFLAISIANLQDYTRAGIKTVPAARGPSTTRLQTIAYTTLLIPVSLVLIPIGTASWLYGATALVTGTLLLYTAARKAETVEHTVWAVRYFRATLLYLPIITIGLVVDVALGLASQGGV